MLNDRLRIIRMYRQYTLQQTAEALGISLQNYQRYEGGSRQPDYATLLKIADFFDISMDFLFGRDDYLQKLGVHFDVPLDVPPRRKQKEAGTK